MIEINLLPQELRPKKKLPIEQISQVKMLLVIIGSVIALHILVMVISGINSKRLSAMRLQWAGLISKNKQIEKLQGNLAEANKKIPLIDQLMQSRIFWSKKLDRLNEQLVAGVWLTEFAIRNEEKNIPNQGKVMVRTLMIRGSAASRTKDEPALIGIFMQNLKDDLVFSENFSEIEMGPIKKRMIEDTSVMDFVLNCRFNQDKVSALGQ